MKTRKNVGLKKYICILLLAVMALVCLSGCSSTKLSEDFDEGKVKEAAQKAVDCLIAGHYEDCVAMMGQEMQAALTAEALGENVESVKEKTGEFREYKSTAVIGQKDSEGADCAVAVVVAAFEKGNLTYNISFNTEMEIIGLWMK